MFIFKLTSQEIEMPQETPRVLTVFDRSRKPGTPESKKFVLQTGKKTYVEVDSFSGLLTYLHEEFKTHPEGVIVKYVTETE